MKLSRITAILVAYFVILSAHADTCQEQRSEVVTITYVVDVFPDPDDPNAVDILHTDIDFAHTCTLNPPADWQIADPPIGWNPNISHDDGPFPNVDRHIPTTDARIYLNPNARLPIEQIPPQFSFLGIDPNMDEYFWFLPENQQTGILYIGWSAENMTQDDRDRVCHWDPNDPLDRVTFAAQWIELRVREVRGPEGGHFSIWPSGSTIPWISTFDQGLDQEDAYYFPVGGHTHTNQGFSKPGVYEVDYQGRFMTHDPVHTLITPIGGEQVAAGGEFDIAWKTEGDSQGVRLDYQFLQSDGSFSAWTLIEDSIATDPNAVANTYVWVAPADLESDVVRIRISDASNKCPDDVADGTIRVAPCDVELPGDIYVDCVVDILDLLRLVQWWLEDNCDQTQNCQNADITRDSLVDFRDFGNIVVDWLTKPYDES